MFTNVLRVRTCIEGFSFEPNKNCQTEGEPSFWRFDWFGEHSAKARVILLDFGTCSLDAVFPFS